MIIDNVDDRRHGWVGSWNVEPLIYDKLTAADIGRTVIYRGRKRPAQAGTLSSWRDGLVFVRYTQGDTAAAAAFGHGCMWFGVSRADNHPDAPAA